MKSDHAGRILLVDDDIMIRVMAGRTLRQVGFTVGEADSGEAALDRFAEEPYDLVMLDVMLPGIDGYEVCRRLRAQDSGRWLPILMLTGLNDSESIESAYSSGATDFITKPINWSLLSHRVRYALRASTAIESVARSRESLARAQRLANMGSWEWSPDTGAIVCSEELGRIFGRDADSAWDATPEALIAYVSAGDRDNVRAARTAAATGKNYQLSYSVDRPDGPKRTVFEQATAARDENGHVVAVNGITQDISERVEAEQRIQHLAFHDNLTGLANRRMFGELADSALERARRLKSVCAVLHLDLDRFKSVNDAYGDAVGDRLLRAIAERLQSSTRAADLTASHRAQGPELVARMSGNAFTLLLVDVRSADDAANIAERLLRAVAQPIEIDERSVTLTASIGIALFPRDADAVESLLRHAEQAMYVAKAGGRAGYRFFDDAMNAVASAKLDMENDLRRALAAGEFRLYFQPKVDAAAGRMLAAEALIRWQHPQRGMVPPGEFIPLAEETGLIVPIGDWVVQEACACLRRWRDAGLDTVPISINLSSTSFMQDGLAELIDAHVKQSGLEPHLLTLEVTESLLMQDVERTVQRLHALRDKGFGLSLDDFGTGYSSLSYLKRFPVDELKIDRSFVRDVANGGHDGALVASIIALGRLFGLRVVAEGVETREQSQFLLHHGCPVQQGYLFAKPMPAEAFAKQLANLGIALQSSAELTC